MRDAPQVDLAMLLNQSAYALGSRLTAALDGLGISVRVYCVLVKAVEGDRTQGQIAEAAWLDKTTMVATVDELERLGLAERRASPSDRRVRVIAVTERGREVLREADRIVGGVYDEVLEGVGAADRAAFLRVLDHLVAGPLAAPFHLERRAPRRPRERASA